MSATQDTEKDVDMTWYNGTKHFFDERSIVQRQFDEVSIGWSMVGKTELDRRIVKLSELAESLSSGDRRHQELLEILEYRGRMK